MTRDAVRRRQIAVLLCLDPGHDGAGRRGKEAEQVEVDPAERFQRAADETGDFEHNADEHPSACSAIVPPRLLGIPALLIGDPVGEIDLPTLIEIESADVAHLVGDLLCSRLFCPKRDRPKVL